MVYINKKIVEKSKTVWLENWNDRKVIVKSKMDVRCPLNGRCKVPVLQTKLAEQVNRYIRAHNLSIFITWRKEN